jgi:hypothetical protein
MTATVLAAHLRLTILRVLAGAPAWTANSSIIHTVAVDFGLMASRDLIRTELSWLAEQSLVTIKDMGALVVATLTERGQDVAEGRVTAPGVQRPSPGS